MSGARTPELVAFLITITAGLAICVAAWRLTRRPRHRQAPPPAGWDSLADHDLYQAAAAGDRGAHDAYRARHNGEDATQPRLIIHYDA